MLFVIALLVFAVVTVAVFVAMSLYDQREAQARVLRDRLSTVQKPTGQSVPDMALLRDEVLSRIPAFDTFLRRSERVSVLQKMLAQGNIDARAGNFLMLCAVSALVFAAIAFIAGGNLLFGWAGALLGFFIPYAYASHMRTRRFQKFEEKFPEAIDTLARGRRTRRRRIPSALRRAEIRAPSARCPRQPGRPHPSGRRQVLCDGGDVAARNRRQSCRNSRQPLLRNPRAL
jgi:Flp pilus assembly protein TadB